MSEEAQLHRDLGRLEAQVASLSAQLLLMQTQVREMHDAITSAKGGWKVLVGVGTVSAGITAVLAKVLGVFWR